MKRTILFFAVLISFGTGSFAQETSKPTIDDEVVRHAAIMDIEGMTFEDVVVILKAKSPDNVFSNKYKVKVTVADKYGKKIWKKTLKGMFLYVFEDGQVQIGQESFSQILIQKSSHSDEYIGMIRMSGIPTS